VFWITLLFYFIVTYTTGMPQLKIDTGPLDITRKGDDVGDGRIRHCLEVFCGTGIIEREYEMMFSREAGTF